MRYLQQFCLILGFCLAGEGLHALVPLPIPAAVYGLVLLFAALCAGIVKADAVADAGHFLIAIMPVLFVAPAVNLLDHWAVIAPQLVPIVLLVVATTLVTFAVSGLVTQALLDRQAKRGGSNE